MIKTVLLLFFVAAAVVLYTGVVYAQDIFEIQVYESELVPKDRWEVEMHLIHINRGTTVADGPVLPTERQTHLSFEVTRGISDEFEMGGYLLLARPGGGPVEFAGMRIRPRVKAPDGWELPVGLSLSLELGFPQPHYEAGSVTLEIRPIVDKKIGRWYFSINPLITHVLRGQESDAGFGFEPSAKVAYDVCEETLSIGLEYIGATGPLSNFRPPPEQVHVLYPNADISIGGIISCNVGVGMGLTRAGERLVTKARFGYLF